MVMELFSKDTKRLRGKDTGSQGKRRHFGRCGRPPALIRAGALISWSARPDISERSAETGFYSLEVFCLGK